MCRHYEDRALKYMGNQFVSIERLVTTFVCRSHTGSLYGPLKGSHLKNVDNPPESIVMPGPPTPCAWVPYWELSSPCGNVIGTTWSCCWNPLPFPMSAIQTNHGFIQVNKQVQKFKKLEKE